jgi:hypothetical protein
MARSSGTVVAGALWEKGRATIMFDGHVISQTEGRNLL